MTSTEAASPSGTARKDQRFWWPVAAGLVSVLISLGIGTTRYTGDASGQWTLSRANAVCSSALGQFGQVMNSQLGSRCSSIASLEQWRGWLMILGMLGVAAGITWALILGNRGAVPPVSGTQQPTLPEGWR